MLALALADHAPPRRVEGDQKRNTSLIGTAVSLEMSADRDGTFELWLKRNRAMNERFFARRGCSRDLAGDLTQDTMLVVWSNRDDSRGDTGRTFRAWAIKIAKTNWAKHWRLCSTRLEPLTDELSHLAMDPGARIDRKQVTVALRAKIDTLPPQEQSCVRMVLQGCTEREIAALLRREIGTVKATLSHAVKS